MIYFDHQSTSKTDPRVVEAMLPYFSDHFGNPQARFVSGEQPRNAIETARRHVAELIGANSGEILFTSNGTESNNLAVKGYAWANSTRGKHIIASKIEHVSVLKPLQTLEKQGFEISWLSVDEQGLVDIDELRQIIRDDTILVVVTHASNEIGTIEPLAEIAEVVHSKNAVLFADGIQTVGNIPVDVRALGVDMMSMAAHQFYGPKGAAGLYVKKGLKLQPLIEGGIQEKGKRSGTENVPAIVGMGEAARLAREELPRRVSTISALGRKLIHGIQERIERAHLTGHPERRLPGHASFCFEFVEGESMLLFLSSAGIEGASGSTCSSHDLKASHVLLAIGVGDLLAQGSLVFSLGKDNTDEEVDKLLEVFPPIVERLRSMSPVTEHSQYNKESFKGKSKH